VVIPSPGAGPDPLRRGIASVRVSTLGPISAVFTILSFHNTRDLVQGLRDDRDELRDADPPVDASGWEARHASNKAMRAREERERDRRATVGQQGNGGQRSLLDMSPLVRGATLPTPSPLMRSPFGLEERLPC
jgi:hypothetical protein